ncbi:hypothetical protein J6590_052661 [Homalodisca vitripennis]|nr:hypothetical protein J6590_052661 [Homalodisca vitripennis]
MSYFLQNANELVYDIVVRYPRQTTTRLAALRSNKGESRYSTRSMVLIKGATVTDRIRTCAISNSDSKSTSETARPSELPLLNLIE